MTRVHVRRIQESDVAAAVRMVHDLADYEKSAEQCVLTENQTSCIQGCSGHMRRCSGT